MPFHDLNIAYISDHAALSNTLAFAKELGYETVALSVAITGKLPPTPPPLLISNVKKPDGLRVLSRLTLTISDTTQNHRLSSLSPNYDIIALRPTTEKTLQHCCSSLECDLISIDFSQRLSFPLKFRTVAAALQRGVRFEICYSPGIVAGSDARRSLISGATQLIRATRGKGIIISSEAKSALGSRAPPDVINLAQVWGLPQERAKEALCEEAGKVARFASIKRTSFRGVVDIVDGGTQPATVNLEAASQVSNHKVAPDNTQSQKPKQHEHQVVKGLKRKASASSLSIPQRDEPKQEKPLSKREMKRRAKKAKLEGPKSSNIATNNSSSAFPLQHESLAPNKPK